MPRSSGPRQGDVAAVIEGAARVVGHEFHHGRPKPRRSADSAAVVKSPFLGPGAPVRRRHRWAWGWPATAARNRADRLAAGEPVDLEPQVRGYRLAHYQGAAEQPRGDHAVAEAGRWRAGPGHHPRCHGRRQAEADRVVSRGVQHRPVEVAEVAIVADAHPPAEGINPASTSPSQPSSRP